MDRERTSGGGKRRYMALASAAIVAVTAYAWSVRAADADQGGISVWLPGSFGSLAAAPGQPGWALGMIYYHSSVSADGAVAASRALRFGGQTANLTATLNAELRANINVGLASPSYTFAQSVLGGQLTLSALFVYGHQRADIDASVPVGNSRADILVMQPTQNRHGERLTDGLHSARDRRILP